MCSRICVLVSNVIPPRYWGRIARDFARNGRATNPLARRASNGCDRYRELTGRRRRGEFMPFNVKKRGKLTYYSQGERPVLSALVTEEQADGDLKIHFAGLTGGYSAQSVLGLDELVTMDPHREIPLVFQCWEKWLRDAGLAQSLKEIDFIEMHAFGCQPKTPNPLLDPLGFAAEQDR